MKSSISLAYPALAFQGPANAPESSRHRLVTPAQQSNDFPDWLHDREIGPVGVESNEHTPELLLDERLPLLLRKAGGGTEWAEFMQKTS